MAYDLTLAIRVRERLHQSGDFQVEEKRMFGGLAFMVNGKMCINVVDDQLMCRFDPALNEQVAEMTGFSPMIMKGKVLEGYCYVDPVGYNNKKDFEYWVNLCLDYNEKAASSKKKSKKTQR